MVKYTHHRNYFHVDVMPFCCNVTSHNNAQQYFPCDDSCIHMLAFQFDAFFLPFARRSDSGGRHGEMDVLLRALVEAEIDGVAVTNQLTALKETIDSLAKVNLEDE